MAGFPSRRRFFFRSYFPAEAAVGEVKERLGELETSQQWWAAAPRAQRRAAGAEGI